MSEKLKEVLKNHLQNKPDAGWWSGKFKTEFIDKLLNDRDYKIKIYFSYSVINFSFPNPSVELQKMIIREAKYNLDAVLSCPDLENFDEEFEQEILDNLMIKDIIE
jgi:hypothetical protein